MKKIKHLNPGILSPEPMLETTAPHSLGVNYGGEG